MACKARGATVVVITHRTTPAAGGRQADGHGRRQDHDVRPARRGAGGAEEGQRRSARQGLGAGGRPPAGAGARPCPALRHREPRHEHHHPADPRRARGPPPGRFFQRSELGRVLWTFRREFAWVGLFSLVANLLMLTPTLYMLQVFDRVMVSGNALTLLALTALTVFLFLVMGFAEWVRSRLLVRASAAFDAGIEHAGVPGQLRGPPAQCDPGRRRLPQQALGDLTALRQFLTGNGVFAFFDLPWTLIYIAVLFVMHPWLGWAAIVFAIVQGTAAMLGHRIVRPLHEKAMEGVDRQPGLPARQAAQRRGRGGHGHARQPAPALAAGAPAPVAGAGRGLRVQPPPAGADQVPAVHAAVADAGRGRRCWPSTARSASAP